MGIKAELPGVDPKDVEINITENMLTVSGECKLKKEEKKRDYHYMERSFGSFRRSVQLPSVVDAEKVRNCLRAIITAVRPQLFGV